VSDIGKAHGDADRIRCEQARLADIPELIAHIEETFEDINPMWSKVILALRMIDSLRAELAAATTTTNAALDRAADALNEEIMLRRLEDESEIAAGLGEARDIILALKTEPKETD
jgi:hypothetical protein